MPRDILRFTGDQKKILVDLGYEDFYLLPKLSLLNLRMLGNFFYDASYWYRDSEIEKELSMGVEVAFRKEDLYIPEKHGRKLISSGQLMTGQLDIMPEFSRKIGAKAHGVIGVRGGVADYSALIFMHLQNTGGYRGEYIFGDRQLLIRTKTKADDNKIVAIRGFDVADSVSVFKADPDDAKLATFPLLAPAGAMESR